MNDENDSLKVLRELRVRSGNSLLSSEINNEAVTHTIIEQMQ